jgi:DNA mismatch repair ATPase MutS
MKVFLLHRDRDLEVRPELHDQIFEAVASGNPFALTKVKRELERAGKSGSVTGPPERDSMLEPDLELRTLWSAMAAGDEFVFEIVKRVVLSGLSDPDEIVYRQRVLADCLEHPDVIRELYALAIEALHSDRHVGSLWSGSKPDWILSRAVRLLQLQLEALKRLRQVADDHAESFRSEGFGRFFAMLRDELADDYLETIERHLRELEFRRGVFESVGLAKRGRARDYVVHKTPEQHWTERLPFVNREASYSFELHPRDDAGFRALETIRGIGLNRVANAVAQSSDHVKSFFAMLRLEIAFYLGCLNLRHALDANGEPTCFPPPLAEGPPSLTARGIYDVSLTLHLEHRAVGNDLDADGKSLVMITGANQGGKSTLLRSIGLAQLMMQSGMFVGAESFRGTVCEGVFTHYKREEGSAMEGGKLAEELSRMSAIADEIAPGSILLCNESFASTNEREGSEIARQVIRAMLDKGIRVFFVTHMYDLAHGFHAQRREDALFLRAEREPDGTRTFKLRAREPLPTSYGADSYERIFGTRRAAIQ